MGGWVRSSTGGCSREAHTAIRPCGNTRKDAEWAGTPRRHCQQGACHPNTTTNNDTTKHTLKHAHTQLTCRVSLKCPKMGERARLSRRLISRLERMYRACEAQHAQQGSLRLRSDCELWGLGKGNWHEKHACAALPSRDTL